ncbi:alpha/beta hydrolase [Schauerella aestuarii]|uniref:alpha/beta hydrolase n=1 Tax=Schauerella aestuarii TaxID=2511204 RepID=UPI00136E1A84|nr:alpha/beta hydrolase-fold protein [Achromobacter aestuarii]MYZ43967.1 alpha/beta hydrolase [Achromobacter aestuarii]
MPKSTARVAGGGALIAATATPLVAATATAYDPPPPAKPMPAQPAELATGVPAAEVTQYLLTRDDPRPDLRLFIWQPTSPPPAAGYPVIYMLDGDTVFESLTDTAASVQDSRRPGAVIVGIGYDIDASLRQAARSYDYTPPSPGADSPVGAPRDPDAVGKTLPGGGADRFLDTLETRIKPFVAAHYPIDANDQTLYGHSYGGLFALHVLLTQPNAFTRYVAASPSFWWNGRYLLQTIARASISANGAARRLTIMVGHDVAPPERPDNTKAVTQQLSQRSDWVVDMVEFPGLTHADMLSASIAGALHDR